MLHDLFYRDVNKLSIHPSHQSQIKETIPTKSTWVNQYVYCGHSQEQKWEINYRSMVHSRAASSIKKAYHWVKVKKLQLWNSLPNMNVAHKSLFNVVIVYNFYKHEDFINSWI